MAGILKNQLVKRLASFTKGLSVDKIDLDILSGRGYLDNLELDEQFMTTVLELPVWMSFTKILCSKIRLKVSFTKLKSEPIRIYIDTVYVEADINKQTQRTDIDVQQTLIDAGLSNTGSTSYGYIEQVIDGMHISVGSIRLTLSSRHHYVTTELNNVELVSTNRKWRCDDLRKTRAYVMPSKEEVLVYKMLTVHHAKFEFFDKSSPDTGNHIPPLKFNFNMIQLLITMKKLVSTNEVLSACLKLVLDDILLVFTPSQLQIILAFCKELSEIVELSAPPPSMPHTPTCKTPHHTPPKSFMQRFSKQNQDDDDDTVIEVVSDEIVETSYHLKTGTIDILLCDDENAANAGSLQFRFEVVQIELFPHRTGNATRRHWTVPLQYVKDAQIYAAEMLGDYAESCVTEPDVTNPLHNLYEMVVVLRCDHFQLLPVMGTQKRQILGPMVFCDKVKFGLSDSEPALVVTIATYYTDKSAAQVPPQNVYIHLNPTEVNFDIPTVWWLREFVASTMTEDFKLMLTRLSKEDTALTYKLKINLVLPHVTIPLTNDTDQGEDRITGIQFWFSKLIISSLTNRMYLPLLSLLHECLEKPAFNGEFGFPNRVGDENCLPELKNKLLLPNIIEELCKRARLRQELLEERARQKSPTQPSTTSNNASPERPGTPNSRRSSIGSVSITIEDHLPSSPLNNFAEVFPELAGLVMGLEFESFSADFLYATCAGSGEKYRSRKFIADVPLQMWLIEQPPAPPSVCQNGHRRLTRNLKRQDTLKGDETTGYLMMFKPSKSVYCNVDREQYIFLIRLQQEIQSFVERIILSVTQIFTTNIQDNARFTVLGLIDHVMVELSLPHSMTPADNASLPDTASTSLSQLSSPSTNSILHSAYESEILFVEPTIHEDGDLNRKLNWVVLSRSDSNIACLSERLQPEEDAISLSSITQELSPLAKGDSKETLLKFIMRVNKKRESESVACQTDHIPNIVANNYQELYKKQLLPKSSEGIAEFFAKNQKLHQCGGQLQIHIGTSSIMVHSTRDVITKIVCQKIALIDDPAQFESKPKCFPFAKWRSRGTEPQLLVRIDISEPIPRDNDADNDVTLTSPSNHTQHDIPSDISRESSLTTSDLSCKVIASNLIATFKDTTLDGLTGFMEPDPRVVVEPMILNCEIRDCEFMLCVSGKIQKLSIPSVKAKLCLDDSWVIGDSESAYLKNEIKQLKLENQDLKRRLSEAAMKKL